MNMNEGLAVMVYEEKSTFYNDVYIYILSMRRRGLGLIV